MANWLNPQITTPYSNFLSELKARDVSGARWFDTSLVSDSQVPEGAKRWNASNLNWDKFASGVWTPLASVYNITVATANNATNLGGIVSTNYARYNTTATWTSKQTFYGTTFVLADNTDTTKNAKFNMVNISTSTERAFSFPDYSLTFAGVDVPQSFSKGQRGSMVTLTADSVIAVDLDLSNNFEVTLTGNHTLENPTNMVKGQSGMIVVTTNAAGDATLDYESFYKYAGGVSAKPVITTSPDAVDYLAYFVQDTDKIFITAIKDVQ